MVDVSNEILDAIEIIVDAKIRENTARIYPGVCKSISGNTCVMSINSRNNTVQFYGSTPTVGSTYRVFVPNGNMSMAFIICSDMTGASGPAASIFVTGLSETDTVTATNGTKALTGKWTQKETQLQTQVPSMTSNTAPSGECFAKSNLDHSDCQPYFAFAGSPNAGLQAHSTSGDAQGWWIGYDFGYSVKINYFEICPQFSSSYTAWERLAQTLTLQGSNDGSTWDDIQSFTRTDNLTAVTTDTHEVLKYTVDNPVTYKMFRVVWTTLTPTSDSYASCSYVQFVGEKTEEVSGHLIKPIRDFGTWTVTATYETDTYTQDVLVDVITEYEIEITKKLYLYRDGDECEGVTGGWGQVNYWGSSASIQKNTDNINVYCPSGNYSCAAVTVNKVDLTQYSKLTINVLESVVNGTGWNSLVILSNRTTPDTASNRAGVIDIYGKTGELSIDISSITGSWYVGVYVNSQTTGECHIKFDKVWLE